MTPGQKLRRLRVVMGVTQNELDTAAGAKPGRVQSYEKKSTVVQPKRDFLEKVITVFRPRLPNLTVDWFFDGVDNLPPGLKANAPTSGFMEYPVIQEIPGFNTGGNFGVQVSASPTPYPAGTFWAAVADNERAPLIRRGDTVLIVPDEPLKPDTVFAIRRADDSVDLFNIVRSDGILLPETIFEGQAVAGLDFTAVGRVVELRRTIEGGVIAFQSSTGLSRSMLDSI